jgi:hypothetical protein
MEPAWIGMDRRDRDRTILDGLSLQIAQQQNRHRQSKRVAHLITV